MTGQATADPEKQEAHREHMLLMKAQVTAIMNGSQWSLCVIDGHRLKAGDVFPGTGYALEKITDHGVIFRKGGKTLQKTLRGIGGS